MSDRLSLIARIGAAMQSADEPTAAVLRDALAAIVEDHGVIAAVERRKERDRLRKHSMESEESTEGAESVDGEACSPLPPSPSSSFPTPHITPSPSPRPPRGSTPRTRDGYPADFLAVWDAYPRRGGGNSKRAAFRAYSARIRAGTDVGVLLDGVRRYAEFIRATGREGTEFVLQAATFFGPSEHWADDWTLPTASTRSAVLPNHDGEADAAWRSVLALIPAWQRRDPDVANRYRALGPATIHAMSAVGGMQILAETPDDKRHFKHRSFVAAFQTSSQAGAA